MENNKQQVGQQEQVPVMEKETLRQMSDWYDVQIGLSGKAAKLSKLKADIAENRLREVFALSELARVSMIEQKNGETDSSELSKEEKEKEPITN